MKIKLFHLMVIMAITFLSCGEGQNNDDWQEDDFNPDTRNIEHDSLHNGNQKDTVLTDTTGKYKHGANTPPDLLNK